MRRLTRRDDRGLATIVVVLALPALLMMGSLVFDGARGVVAERQAQNAADAAALAKATDCAKDDTGTDVSGYATNGTTLDSASCDPASQTATATASKDVTLAFAAGIAKCPGNVCHETRSATARWGAINSATTVPATISACAFDAATSGGTVFPSDVQVVSIGGAASTDCPGSGPPPGNFGWLVSDGSSCAVTTTLTAAGTAIVDGSNGNGSNQPYACINGVEGGGLNSEILIPMYTATAGTGVNATYTISGYARFHITGWDFQNGPSPKAYPTGGIDSCTSHDCIEGYFVKFVTEHDSNGTGIGTDFGAVTVQLSS